MQILLICTEFKNVESCFFVCKCPKIGNNNNKQLDSDSPTTGEKRGKNSGKHNRLRGITRPSLAVSNCFSTSQSIRNSGDCTGLALAACICFITRRSFVGVPGSTPTSCVQQIKMAKQKVNRQRHRSQVTEAVRKALCAQTQRVRQK